MKILATLGRDWSGLSADWRVTEDMHPASNREEDPRPIRSLEFKRAGDAYWHGAECWREETGRVLPIRATRWALSWSVPARGLVGGVL